jgi:type IV secretory pathway protease TraF
MLPRLRPGSLVVALKLPAKLRSNIKVGQVVIIDHNGLEKIKRVAKVRGNKKGNEVYVLGDNPLASTDSRNFGWLPSSAVRAKVVWPR